MNLFYEQDDCYEEEKRLDDQREIIEDGKWDYYCKPGKGWGWW